MFPLLKPILKYDQYLLDVSLIDNLLRGSASVGMVVTLMARHVPGIDCAAFAVPICDISFID